MLSNKQPQTHWHTATSVCFSGSGSSRSFWAWVSLAPGSCLLQPSLFWDQHLPRAWSFPCKGGTQEAKPNHASEASFLAPSLLCLSALFFQAGFVPMMRYVVADASSLTEINLATREGRRFIFFCPSIPKKGSDWPSVSQKPSSRPVF